MGLHGPADHRKTTDKITLAVFLSFACVLGGLSYFVQTKGNVGRLGYDTDSFGNVCGQGNTPYTTGDSSRLNTGVLMTGAPYTYYTNPTDADAPAVCVNECPLSDGTVEYAACTGCPSSGDIPDSCIACARAQVCVNTLTLYGSIYAGENSLATAIAGGTWAWQSTNAYCPPFVYKTRAVNGVCWPTQDSYDGSSAITSAFHEILDQKSIFVQWYLAIFKMRYTLLYGMLVSAGCAIVVLLLLRFASRSIYTHAVLAACGFSMLLVMTSLYWIEYSKRTDAIGTLNIQCRNIFLVMGLFCALSLPGFALAIWSVRRKVGLAARIAGEASASIQDNSMLLISPVLTCIFLGAYLYYFQWTLQYATTTHTRTEKGANYMEYSEVDPSESLIIFIVVLHILGLIWMIQFVTHAGSFVLMFTMAHRYFANGYDYEIVAPDLSDSIYVFVRYHMGTAALGSLTMAASSYSRATLYLIHEVFKEAPETSKWGVFLRSKGAAANELYERLTTYVNKNGYVQVILYGFDYFFASWTHHQVTQRNRLFWNDVKKVSLVGFFLVKILVSGAGSLYVYAMASTDDDAAPSLWIVMIAAAVATWLVADAFIELYAGAMNAILTCFMEDKIWNDGTEEKPYHFKDHLHKFLHGVRDDIASDVRNYKARGQAGFIHDLYQKLRDRSRKAADSRRADPLGPNADSAKNVGKALQTAGTGETDLEATMPKLERGGSAATVTTV